MPEAGFKVESQVHQCLHFSPPSPSTTPFHSWRHGSSMVWVDSSYIFSTGSRCAPVSSDFYLGLSWTYWDSYIFFILSLNLDCSQKAYKYNCCLITFFWGFPQLQPSCTFLLAWQEGIPFFLLRCLDLQEKNRPKIVKATCLYFLFFICLTLESHSLQSFSYSCLIHI